MGIDKLSCKNLFEPLILDLVQFFTLKDLVEMYKMKKIFGNNDNCAIIRDRDTRQSELKENSLNGTVFTGHL